MHKLEFLNNVHNMYGPNVTVRLGRKWSERVSPGDMVEIAKTGEEPTFKARILAVLVCRLDAIPPAYLHREHDPDCRNSAGLLAAMQRAYGADQVDGGSIVTALMYEVLA